MPGYMLDAEWAGRRRQRRSDIKFKNACPIKAHSKYSLDEGMNEWRSPCYLLIQFVGEG